MVQIRSSNTQVRRDSGSATTDGKSPPSNIRGLRKENESLKEKLLALEKEINSLKSENNADLRTHSTTAQQRSRKVAAGPLPPSLVATSQQLLSSKKQRRYAIINTITDVEVLHVGLLCCGFSSKRQQRVKLDTNITRFKAFFGVSPTTVVPILKDLKDVHGADLNCITILMTMNWYFLYETREVLSGRWGFSENQISKRCIQGGKLLQQLKEKKIRFEFDEEREFPASYDTLNCIVQELRQDPSASHYDHKSNSCGFVSVILVIGTVFIPFKYDTSSFSRNMSLVLILMSLGKFGSMDHL